MTKLKQFVVTNYALLLILLLGAFLRLYCLDYQSLWDDELGAMIESNPDLSFKEAFSIYENFDNMPPLNFLLLRYIFMLFGHTSFVLRLVSALCGIAAIYATYLLGRELSSKKTGLFAAAILAVNSYHIYYSQEGRPYAFFALFTLLSFYKLAAYLKQPGWKNALYYSLFTCLMLHAHYYSLFPLISQLFLILYFLIIFDTQKKKMLFVQLGTAGLLAAVAFLPAIPRLLYNAESGPSWITLPEPEVYTNYLHLFFGNSELITPLIYIGIILFFVRLSTENDKGIFNVANLSPVNFSFIILVPCLILYMLIPLMRSYLVVPSMVHRYFIPLLPMVCLLAGIGFSSVKNNIVSKVLLLILVIFSLNNIFVIQLYYSHVEKAQFRENANFMHENKTPDEKIIGRICWHYSYYFKDVKPDPFFQTTINNYTDTLRTDSSNLKSFWNAGVHEKWPELTEKNRNFLNRHYYIDKRVELFDMSATHYVAKDPSILQLDLINFNPVKPDAGSVLELNGTQNVEYPEIQLTKGVYTFSLCAQSIPLLPVNNINAHITLLINGAMAGGCFLESSDHFSMNRILFSVKENGPVKIELKFDNDINFSKSDRNMKFTSALIKKES